jgi:CHAT domain-containing protein
MGNYKKTEPLFLLVNDNLNNQIEKTFGFLSEKEKEQFLTHNINHYFEIFNSFFLNIQDKKPLVNTVSYNNELIHKGMLLQSNTALRQSVYDSRDDDLIETYNRFIDTHKELSVVYSKPLVEREVNIDSLENIAEGFEKELVQQAKNLPGIENLTGLTKTRWQDVQQSLTPDEAAIEFIDFHYYNNGWTDSILYCALVLRKDYTYPCMVFLFEERQLQKYLSTQKATNSSSYISKLYSYSSDLPPADTNKPAGNPLYQLAWKPVDSLLTGVNTVYLSLSGLLHKVAFNAIPATDSSYLSDIYDINIVSSTRILASTKKDEADLSADFRASLYGGITYSMDSTDLISMAQLYREPDNDLLALRSVDIPDDGRGLTWIDLPGTLTEVSDIQKIFQAKQIAASLYTGKYATEESFKYLSRQRKSPEVLHMATHGFFFQETESGKRKMDKVDLQRGLFEEPAFTFAENPLLRSGILLAGASRIWENMPAIENVEDGTLTAYEVSNMNLSNTRLVVLLACETGLGDVKGSEGVFGLQRAFKMAGVQYLIMSLWQVPDYQTSELMKLFYTNWLTGLNIKEAFAAAQEAMRQKYTPFYWAAFILVE